MRSGSAVLQNAIPALGCFLGLPVSELWEELQSRAGSVWNKCEWLERLPRCQLSACTSVCVSGSRNAKGSVIRREVHGHWLNWSN